MRKNGKAARKQRFRVTAEGEPTREYGNMARACAEANRLRLSGREPVVWDTVKNRVVGKGVQ